MQTNFRGRDFIGDLDFSKEEVETVLEVAWDLKRKRALGEPHALLRDKVLAMLFFFSSTRTSLAGYWSEVSEGRTTTTGSAKASTATTGGTKASTSTATAGTASYLMR